MANGLKYGKQDLTALQFDAPITGVTSRYDFTEWTFNTDDQPSSGITVTENEVVITKFRPNVPIITSNFTGTGSGNTPTAAELAVNSKNFEARFTGLTANQSLLINYTRANQILTTWTANLRGLYFAPYNTQTNGEVTVAVNPALNVYYNDDTTEQLGNDLTVRGEGLGYGWMARVSDRTAYTKMLPDWKGFPDNVNDHWQLALIIHTSAATDGDGFITLSTPIVFKIDNPFIVDPTTIEGYRAAVGADEVYNKEMNFANVLDRHGFTFVETGTYSEAINGHYDEILGTYGNNAHTALVISERAYRDKYDHIRIPAITDLGRYIYNRMNFKFWARLDKDPEHTHIWDSIEDAFLNNDITEASLADHLFATSRGGIEELHLRFNLGLDANDLDTKIINMGSIFDNSTLVESVYFTITTGILKSLHNAFRSSGVMVASFNKKVNIIDWRGAFEGAAMVNFPYNVAAANELVEGTKQSGPTSLWEYAADGSHLNVFGEYKDETQSDPDDMMYTAVFDPCCRGAFSRSDISEIRYILDMKYVYPVAYDSTTGRGITEPGGGVFNAVFNAPDLAVAYIKNLNKGDWVLDGDETRGVCAGNLTNFDEDSANYLLENLFDLSENTTDLAHLESDVNSFNGWVISGNGNGASSPLAFNAWNTCTFSKTITSGTMKVQVGLSNCTLTVTNNGTTTTLSGGKYDGIDNPALTLSAGACTFTFTKVNASQDMSGTLDLLDPFRSELTANLSSANIYLPADWATRDIIHSSAVTSANSKGWTVYVGGQPIDSTYFNE